MKHLTLLVSLFLLLPNLIFAQEECIFNKYINVSGDFVVTDCTSTYPTIKVRENSSIFLELKNNAINVKPHDQETKQMEIIKKDSNTYEVRNLRHPNENQTGYYNLYLITFGRGLDLFIIDVLFTNVWDRKYPVNISPQINESPPICTKNAWSCPDWEQYLCPPNEIKKRQCKLSNTSCLNPEVVKPDEVINCRYIHPPKESNKFIQFIKHLLNNLFFPIIVIIVAGVVLLIITPKIKKWQKTRDEKEKRVSKKKNEKRQKTQYQKASRKNKT